MEEGFGGGLGIPHVPKNKYMYMERSLWEARKITV
jgi:hypothetical protein